MTDPRDSTMVTRGSSRYGASAEVLRVCRSRGDVAKAESQFIGFRVFRRAREARRVKETTK